MIKEAAPAIEIVANSGRPARAAIATSSSTQCAQLKQRLGKPGDRVHALETEPLGFSRASQKKQGVLWRHRKPTMPIDPGQQRMGSGSSRGRRMTNSFCECRGGMRRVSRGSG
eukprot:scaffold74620_cov101-Phaeocystis_antarctica.AAC.6